MLTIIKSKENVKGNAEFLLKKLESSFVDGITIKDTQYDNTMHNIKSENGKLYLKSFGVNWTDRQDTEMNKVEFEQFIWEKRKSFNEYTKQMEREWYYLLNAR